MTGFVSAEGLTSNPDNIHFNTKSLLEFGARYYEEFKKLEDKSQVLLKRVKRSTLFALRWSFYKIKKDLSFLKSLCFLE